MTIKITMGRLFEATPHSNVSNIFFLLFRQNI